MRTDTLTEAERVVQAVWSGIWFGVALLLFFYLTHRGAEGAPMRWQRWWAALRERYLTSSADEEDATEDALEPGDNTPGTKEAFAHTDGVRAGSATRTGTEALRISRRMSDVEVIALLAVQRTAEGKERFSANAIAALMGGTRAEVLAQVRAIRSVAPPTFPPLSPEQQAAREQLGLVQRG